MSGADRIFYGPLFDGGFAHNLHAALSASVQIPFDGLPLQKGTVGINAREEHRLISLHLSKEPLILVFAETWDDTPIDPHRYEGGGRYRQVLYQGSDFQRAVNISRYAASEYEEDGFQGISAPSDVHAYARLCQIFPEMAA